MQRIMWRFSVIITLIIANLFNITLAQDTEANLDEHISISQPLAGTMESEGYVIFNVANYAISPSGDLIAITDVNGKIFIWDLITENILFELQEAAISGRDDLVWSPNGEYITTTFPHGAIIWNATTGELTSELRGHPVELISDIFLSSGYELEKADILAFSPDSSILATGSFYDDAVILWDIESGEIKDFLYTDGVKQGTRYMEFSLYKNVLVVGTGAKIDIWDVGASQLIHNLMVDHETLALSPDGEYLAVGFGRFNSYINVYDTNTGNELRMFEAPLSVDKLLWTSNSQNIIGNFTSNRLVHDDIQYVGHSIRAWDILTGQSLQIFAPVETKNIGINIAPSETIIGIGRNNFEGTGIIWDRNTGEVFDRHASGNINLEFDLSLENASDFSLNQESLYLAVLYTDNLVIWDYETGVLMKEIQIANSQLNKIDWLDNKNLVVHSQNHELFLIEIH